MKRFILKVIRFLLPIFFIAVVLEFFLRSIPNDYKSKADYMNNHSNEIEVLILGSSHNLYGINPEHFAKKTYNMAYVSQTLDLDYKILEKYQNSFRNLKTVIVDVSYFSLYSKLETETEAWRAKNYNIYYGISTAKFIDGFEILANNFSANFDRIKLYYNLTKNGKELIDGVFSNKNKNGWISLKSAESVDSLEETGFSASERHTFNINQQERVKIYHEQIQALYKIVSWSNLRNIKIVFVTTPTYKSYYNKLNKAQWRNTYKMIENICNQNSNCVYINSLKDNIFQEKDFYDADHLSEIGAQKFSKMINNKIMGEK